MRWAIVGAALLLAMPGVAATQDLLTPEERAWLQGHGPIRYAPDPAYPPFEQVADGVVEGINIDLLNRMSRNLGVEFEIVVYEDWGAVLDGMQAGEVDLVGSLAQTPEREGYMDFHGPYMELGEVFYVRADSPYTRNEDMEGKRVAVIEDYAAAVWLAQNRPGIIQVPVDDMRSGLEALSTGQVDAFFENIPVTGYIIRQEGFNNVRILDEPLYYSPANWGVPKDHPFMLSIIEKGMDSIPLGEQTAVFEYWSGYDLGVRRAPHPVSMWNPPVVLGLAGGVAVGAAWIVALRRTVGRKTAELRHLNEDLERRVAQRTAALQEANNSLDAFASSVSHDLQQPLLAMRLQCQVANVRLQQGQVPDITSLERQVRRMERLVTAVLDFSRPTGVQERFDTPIEPLVRELEPVLRAGTEGNCEVVVQEGLSAYADPQLLRVVLLNIVGNAWKFTAGRPDARIEIGGDGTSFFVRDNGPGFDAAALGDRVFQPFVRGSEATGVRGLGIGLATAARIVKAHGGRIWAESTPGRGAAFHWTMPHGRPPRPPRPVRVVASVPS